jgi:2-C-methyl-D-erythritol 4-phosphate cytidylyltransferase
LGGPKQYALLAGEPMVVHTLRAFAEVPGLGQGVVVVAPNDQQMAEVFALYPQTQFAISNSGGATRAQSVLAGLLALQNLGVDGHDWVLVHDAARCLVTPSLIQKLLLACQSDAVGGLLALPLPDTLKAETQGRVSSTLPRSGKWLAQTPQMFRWDSLFGALAQAGDQVTDEASALEALGEAPLLVPSASFNFKVTYQEDMTMAEAVLQQRKAGA